MAAAVQAKLAALSNEQLAAAVGATVIASSSAPLVVEARDGGDPEYPFGLGLAGVIGVAVGVAASLVFVACACRLALSGYSCRKEVIPPPPKDHPDDQNQQNKPVYSSAYSGSI